MNKPAERLTHGIESAAATLDCPVRKIYTLLAAGELRSFKDGKRRLIPHAELQRYINRKMAEAQ